MKAATLSLVLALCSSCLAYVPPTAIAHSASEVDSRAEIRSGPYDIDVTVRAPFGPITTEAGEQVGGFQFRASAIPGHAPRDYRLLIVVRAFGPSVLEHIADDAGREFTLGSSKLGDAPTKDEFGERITAITDRDYLEAHRGADLRLCMWGEASRCEFTVPAIYVDGFLRACDRGLGRPGS